MVSTLNKVYPTPPSLLNATGMPLLLTSLLLLPLSWRRLLPFSPSTLPSKIYKTSPMTKLKSTLKLENALKTMLLNYKLCLTLWELRTPLPFKTPSRTTLPLTLAPPPLLLVMLTALGRVPTTLSLVLKSLLGWRRLLLRTL